MSDRPCNLVEWRRLKQRDGDRVTIDKPEGSERVQWSRDGIYCGTYYLLPDEAGCAAFGGECVC